MSEWRPIETAPKDGTPIEIKGRRFHSETHYTATAVWAVRKCPAEIEDWFPATDAHDGKGSYESVTHWRPLSNLRSGRMDPERRLELIALLATDQAWDSVVIMHFANAAD